MKEVVLAVEVEDFTIRYFRTQGEASFCEEGGMSVYGVAASKYINNQEVESIDAGFISENKAYIDKLITALGKNTVTPMTLYEVLDDMIECGF